MQTPGSYLQCVHFLNRDTGFVVSTNLDGGYLKSRLYQTINGGYSWDSVWIRDYPQAALRDISEAPDGRLFMSISAGIPLIYYSENRGVSWDSIMLPDATGFAMEEFEYASPDTFYITGWAGEIYRSIDAGYSWEEVYFFGTPYEIMVDTECINPFNCLVTGYASTIVRSTDGGNTWVNVLGPGQGFIQDIECWGNDSCVFVGGNSVVVGNEFYFGTSYDGGETWTVKRDTNMLGMRSILKVDETLYAFGGKLRVLKSEDYGLSWILDAELGSDSSSHFVDVQYLEEYDIILAAADSGRVYRLGAALNGISEPVPGSSLDIYPQPSSGQIRIESEKKDWNRVSIWNTLGQLIFEADFQTQLDLTHIQSGSYQICLIGDNFERSCRSLLISR